MHMVNDPRPASVSIIRTHDTEIAQLFWLRVQRALSKTSPKATSAQYTHERDRRSFVFVWVREVRNWDKVWAGLQRPALNWTVLMLEDVMERLLEELRLRIWKARRKNMKSSKVSLEGIWTCASTAKGWEMWRGAVEMLSRPSFKARDRRDGYSAMTFSTLLGTSQQWDIDDTFVRPSG
ncbi:uncharacterized protein BJ212DRAFT_1301377 [Suillus subaureus]|uniref:Uncharacterized protein n=1 Tax=Suillus subaureus TaxID=48587 RepID=A0A9P7E7B7_9AGAM|nr:uncharacterized protein BJ212DRAFT_1301377 [Suillus subaureus]KAG1812910.1 hypothetical protein BJ212DRAFT_1301377 [Suillus subaureus]